MEKILVVDDDEAIRVTLSDILESNGFHPVTAGAAEEALEIFKGGGIVSVLLDLIMPGRSGIEIMKELKAIEPDIPVIFLTAFGDIDTAIDTVKAGAYDFIVKPPKIDRLIYTLRRAIEKYNLVKTLKRLSTSVEASLEWHFGKSEKIRSVLKQVEAVAGSDFSVIIHGETGVGKTLLARTIHNLSSRAGGPFIRVDIGAIPENLIESELFGYEKGAFTGADRRKKGYFELAHRGTIYIDELENASPSVQAKLLSAVEDKKIYPLGSNTAVEIDIRVISSTNIDIGKAVREKRFREDLFFRLAEFMIHMPPLRERRDDIDHFANRFVMETARELNKNMEGVSEKALAILREYPWPGNVRELKNVMKRAVLFCNGSEIGPEDIEFLITEERTGKGTPLLPLRETSALAVMEAESKAIRQALRMTGGNKSRAAEILQVDYKTLLTKIKEYGIS